MTTPRAPNAPNPYGQVRTVHVDDDGDNIAGQTNLIRKWGAREIYETNSQGHNLTNDFNAEAHDHYKNAPSTPTRGGSQRKKQRGGIESGANDAYSTPPSSPREVEMPNRPTRVINQNSNNMSSTPVQLFPAVGRRRQGRRENRERPAQGGASLKCGPKSVKKTDARGKAYCAKCNRNHVKTWDRFAKNYYCGFDPDAYSAQIKQSRKRIMGGKKTKRTKRSHKKTRRTHKKSKSHRKRR